MWAICKTWMFENLTEAGEYEIVKASKHSITVVGNDGELCTCKKENFYVLDEKPKKMEMYT